MITDDFFDRILIAPIYDLGVDRLCIVCGDASSAFSRYHVERLADLERTVTIELIVGMTPVKGLSIDEHENFKFLAKSKEYPNVTFKCRYVKSDTPPVHSNVYVWLKNRQPTAGFIGSANYTFASFLDGQKEVMDEAQSGELIKMYRDLGSKSISCSAGKIEDKVKFFDSPFLPERVANANKPRGQFHSVPLLLTENDAAPKSGTASMQVGLHQLSGEAEFYLPEALGRTDFFPSNGKRFVLIADDGWENTMSIHEYNGRKSLNVATNKRLFTHYLKARLGLQPYEIVDYEHLLEYGRSKIEFTKADGYYYLDFDPSSIRKGSTGIHSIVEGQYYTSQADGGTAFGCAYGTFGATVNFQHENPQSNVLSDFLSDRMSYKNIDNFKQSDHYQNVFKRYKQYPPPKKVKQLIYIGKLDPADLN